MRRFVILVLALTVVACGGTDENTERAPDEALAAVSDAVLAATSFTFQVGYEGEPIEVEAGLTLDRVDGVFESPALSRADVRVKTLGLTAILEVITEGDRLWQRVPFAEDFEEVTGTDLITGTDIFSDDGLGALISTDVTDPVWSDATELEEFPGESLTTITGTVSGERLVTLTLGYLQGTTADVTFYLSGDEVRRLVLVETVPDSPRTWTLDVWAYGQPVDITVP